MLFYFSQAAGILGKLEFPLGWRSANHCIKLREYLDRKLPNQSKVGMNQFYGLLDVLILPHMTIFYGAKLKKKCTEILLRAHKNWKEK